jgi:hypothetical protein
MPGDLVNRMTADDGSYIGERAASNITWVRLSALGADVDLMSLISALIP